MQARRSGATERQPLNISRSGAPRLKLRISVLATIGAPY